MTIIKGKWNNMPMTVKVSTAYLLCSILQRCLSFITMPLFTRLLTTEQYGQVNVYQSWRVILTLFLTLNLDGGSFSTAMVKFEDDRTGYISSIEGICLSLSALFLLIYLPFRNLWNKLFELPTYLVCLMVFEILTATALLLWNGKQRFAYKYKSVVAVTLAMSFISPIIQYILVVTHSERGYARIIGAAITFIAIGGFFFIFNAIKGKKLFNRDYWKYALGFNIPLLAYYMSQNIFDTSDRIMISHLVGTDKAGIYGVAYSLAMILTFVLNAVNNSYVPWYYGKMKEGRLRENRSVSLGIAGILAVLLLGVIWFAPEIIGILAGRKYAEAVPVVPPVAMSLLLLFYSQLFINVEFFYEEKTKLVWASIGAAAANLILNWIFIRIFGFVAAAYTTLASYMIFAFANNMAMKKVLAKNGVADDGFSYKGLIGLFIGFVVISYLGVALYKYFILRLAVTVAVVCLAIIERKKLISFISMIRKKEGT